MIKQNEGSIDRIVRIIIGIALLVIGYLFLVGTAQIITFVIGAVALLTGIVGFCGLYDLFGISTCSVKK